MEVDGTTPVGSLLVSICVGELTEHGNGGQKNSNAIYLGGFILYNYVNIKSKQYIASNGSCWLFCTFYVKKYMLGMCQNVPFIKSFTKAVYQRRLVKASNLKNNITNSYYNYLGLLVLAYIYKAVYFIILSRTDLCTYCDIFSF